MPRATTLSTLVLAAALAVSAAAGMTGTAAAEEPRTVLYLVDGSGSMWARFDTPEEKRAKIDVVRELLKPLISSDAASRIGLGSYGHRRRGDCSDIEIIAAPGTDRAAVLGPLEKLNPKGKGPLAEAIRQGAAAIGQSRPASIVVIGDGMDNCRQNACIAAAEIAKSSPGLAIHVVSIGVDPGDHPALQCIAKETGGKFYDARDPVALAAAITDAGHLAGSVVAEGKAGNAAPALTLPDAALRATLALAAGGAPLDLKARWRIAKADGGETIKTFESAAIAEDVAPGSYTVEAEIDGLTAQGSAVVETGKPVTLALALNAGRLTLKTKRDKDAAAGRAAPIVTISADATAENAGRTVQLGRLDNFDAVLPPRGYRIVVADGQLREERQVNLTAGSQTVAEFNLTSGTLALSAAMSDGAPALSEVTFSVQEDDPDSPDGRRELMRSRANEPVFTLPAGTYYIMARTGFAEARERIAVSAGASITKKIVMPAAPVKLSATVGGAPPPANAGLLYRIVSLDGDPHEMARTSGPEFNGVLAAGRYRVTATLEGHSASTSQDVTVEAGKPLTSVLRIEAGTVSFKSAAAIAGSETFWDVHEAGGRAVWHSTLGEPKVLLAPGKYSVRLEARDKTIEAAFEVVGGENKSIKLGPN